ncbi:MAG: hypothetical protein RI953_971 [Pseudomonadota bacterium]|jgi:hypothetical protein
MKEKEKNEVSLRRFGVTFVWLASFASLFIATGLASAHEVEARLGQFQRIKRTMEFGRTGHVLSQLPDGKILVAGGAWGDFGGEPVAEVFDPVKATFRSLPSRLTNPRSGAPQITFADGKMMLLGGSSDFELALRSSDVFDPVSGEFTVGPEMSKDRSGHSATLLPDGRVLVVGGQGTGDCVHDTIEILNPTNGTFELLPQTLLIPRMNHTATLIDGKRLLIAGGETGSSCESDVGENEFLASAEIINLQNMSSEPVLSQMNEPRLYHTATPLKDGRILFAGGLKITAVTVQNLEIFDTAKMEFSSVGSLLVSRALHASIPLPNGEILVTGGVSDGIPQVSAERCAPLEEKFVCRSAGQMSTPRWQMSSLLMSDGRAMIVGGLTNKIEPGQKRSGPSRSIEIFNP